jgi:hypothetical protein
MRHLLRGLIALTLFVVCSAVTAEALTVRDVIELSKSGVSDQVLLALIEADHRVYTLDTAALKEMKDAGVSEQVVIAMIRAGRTRPAPPVATETPAGTDPQQQSAPDADQPPQSQSGQNEPQVIVIDHHDAPVDQGAGQGIAIAYPIYIPTMQRHSHGGRVGAGQRPGVQPAATYPIPNYPLGTLAPQQPFVNNPQRGATYPVPNYPLGTLAPQQPLFMVPQPMMRAPICEPRVSPGGATTVVCR